MGRKEAEQPTMRQGCPPEKPLFCGIEPVTVMGVTVSGPWICGVDEADCHEKLPKQPTKKACPASTIDCGDIIPSLAGKGICGADEAECKSLDNISKVCGEGSMSSGASGMGGGLGAAGGAGAGWGRQACPPEKPLDCGDFFGVLKGICGASEAECRKFLFTMGRKEAEQPTMRQGCPPEKPLFCGIEPVTVMGVTVSGPWICGVDEADCHEKLPKQPTKKACPASTIDCGDIIPSLAGKGICGADEAECKFLDNISKVCGEGSMNGGGSLLGGGLGGGAGAGSNPWG